MNILELLDQIHHLHWAGQSPADAELLTALGELAAHAGTLKELLEIGEQLAQGMQSAILHQPEPMTPADLASRGYNADTFLELLGC